MTAGWTGLSVYFWAKLECISDAGRKICPFFPFPLQKDMLFQYPSTVRGKLVGFLVGLFVVFWIPQTWALRWWGFLDNKDEEIVTNPGFVQLKKMTYDLWVDFKKTEKAEGRMEGAGVGGSLAWRSVGPIPLQWVRQHLSFLPGLFPAATKDKAPEPQLNLPAWREKLSWIPSSVFDRPLMPSKEHASPSGHFCPFLILFFLLLKHSL